MNIVIDNSADESAASALPALMQERKKNGIRLSLLPPGLIDIKIKMGTHLLDVNLGSTSHNIAVNSDRLEQENVPANSMAYWPLETEVHLQTENPLPGCVLEIDDIAMRRILDDAEIPKPQHGQYQNYKQDKIAADIGRAAIQYLMHDDQSESKTDDLLLESFALGLTSRMIAGLDGDSDVEDTIEQWSSRGSDNRINRAIDWVEENVFNQSLRLSDMASVAGLSPCHFGTVFKSRTGFSPYAYILKRRAECARDLIAGTRRPLSQISYESGFSSQAHMTAIIKRHFGATPGMIRN